MTETLALSDWLQYLSKEYLTSYLKEGGAGVKFAVSTAESDTAVIVSSVRSLAAENGFIAFVIDAAEVKVHLVDRLFFACASEVPWSRLTDHALRRFATDEGFSSPPKVPDGASFAQAVAEHSGFDVEFVRQRLVHQIYENVFKDRSMVRDFRYAMWSLCQNRLIGSPAMGADQQILEQWLTGRLIRVSELRQRAIFTKVNRTNARLHLESLLHWLKVARIPGTVIVLNLDRLLDPTSGAGGERYSRASLLDAYEVLRQFIDSIDELEGLLLVPVAHEGILDADRRGRGFGSYHALRNRVYDEVRDRAHANPAGSLVRLTTGVPG